MNEQERAKIVEHAMENIGKPVEAVLGDGLMLEGIARVIDIPAPLLAPVLRYVAHTVESVAYSSLAYELLRGPDAGNAVVGRLVDQLVERAQAANVAIAASFTQLAQAVGAEVPDA